MNNPSGNEGIARASENLYDHGQRMRVKAWRLIQAGDREEAQKLLSMADMCDRSLVPMLSGNEMAWKRE